MSLAPTTSGTDAGRAGMIDGEFVLTGEDFTKIARMVHEMAGIHLPETKATLVYARLTKRLRALGLQSFREYCALVQEERGVDERAKMLAALTTNVTRFYREPHHFDQLRTSVLPRLLEAARHGGRVRVWSAGCSSGQEPYTIALTILELMPEASNYDIRILASDVDPDVIEQARSAHDSSSAVESVPPGARAKWVRGDARNGYTLASQVTDLVALRELNLIGPWPMKGGFQAIFCRNVTIYFDQPTRDRLWSRFAGALVPGGFLFIGHSERLGGPAAQDFEPCGVTAYRYGGKKA